MSVMISGLVALPFAGFLLITLLRPSPRLAGYLATAAVGAAFIVAVAAFASLLGFAPEERALRPLLWRWVQSGSFHAEVRLLYDPLSALMCLVVTGIGALIHLYSTGYMAGDSGYRRYFGLLNLFIATMLLLVLADNYLLLMVGWAGVGLSSYLLIGHWWERAGVAAAATKAFIVNTLGDIGLMVALFVMWTRVGDVSYEGVLGRAAGISPGVALAISLCLLLAAVAKSAQLPLQVWLPDAMAGPTPVSALIHAATMVTAGVYLMARSSPLLVRSTGAMAFVATIGALTALIAALAATSQTNIKRVLAYSTVSQLGYMFLAVGVGAYGAGLFHLYAHALYKACLFLGAGAVIHALHGEEELRLMGGLRHRLPLVYWSMISGAAALAGIPIFSGFWSKDEVLVAAFFAPHGNWLLGAIALLTGGLTGYYAFRMVLLTFNDRRDVRRGVQLNAPTTPPTDIHRPPAVIWAPVALLGALSLVGGAAQYLSGEGTLARFLEPSWSAASPYEPHFSGAYWLISGLATALALLGAGLAWLLHSRGQLPSEARGAGRVFLEGLYFDRAYDALIVRPLRSVADFASGAFEHGVVDRTVLGVARMAQEAGASLSSFQSGYLRSYVLGVLTGAVALLLYVLWMVVS